MNYFRYTTKDGRQILSPNDLSYAMSAVQKHICIQDIKEKDLLLCSILPNAEVAHCLQLALENTSCENGRSGEAEFYHHYCIYQDGKIYINNGGYKPLETVLQTASEREKDYIMTQIATQAAHAHHTLKLIQSKTVSV